MMQKPFQVTEEMQRDLEAEMAKVNTQPGGITKLDEGRLPLLIDREQTHGSFEQNALISQSIKRIMRATTGWELLTDVERESMDMIAFKFSRILSGKSLELQHWEDIVGYAKLAEDQCKPL